MKIVLYCGLIKVYMSAAIIYTLKYDQYYHANETAVVTKSTSSYMECSMACTKDPSCRFFRYEKTSARCEMSLEKQSSTEPATGWTVGIKQVCALWITAKQNLAKSTLYKYWKYMQFMDFRTAILESNIAFLNPVNCILDYLSFNLCYIISPANINKFFATWMVCCVTF